MAKMEIPTFTTGAMIFKMTNLCYRPLEYPTNVGLSLCYVQRIKGLSVLSFFLKLSKPSTLGPGFQSLLYFCVYLV